MRKISATYIFPGDGPPLKHGILILENDGTVAELTDTGGKLQEQEGLEYYSGIITPGFINAYCKLKDGRQKDDPLNVLKTQEDANINVPTSPDHELYYLQTFKKADFLMQHEGIVAVADVTSSTASVNTKMESNIHYHTFIPVPAIHTNNKSHECSTHEKLKQEFCKAGLPVSSIIYLSGNELHSLLNNPEKKLSADNKVLMINIRESEKETGNSSGTLHSRPSDNRSAEKVTAYYTKADKDGQLPENLSSVPDIPHVLVINNNGIHETGLEIKEQCSDRINIYEVICPASTIHRGNKLPATGYFHENKHNICLGTADMESNPRMSVLQEMIILQAHFPEVSLQDLIGWGSMNGAKALNIANRTGSFEKGKKPGINLITGVDLKGMKLTGSSRIKVLQHPDLKERGAP